MQHRGETLKAILRKLKVSQRQLGRLLGRHHNTVGNYIDSGEIPDKLLLEIGEKLDYDVTQDYPFLTKSRGSVSQVLTHVEEPVASYMRNPVTTALVPETLPDCQKALMSLQAQYISLSQDYIRLLQTSPQHQHQHAA